MAPTTAILLFDAFILLSGLALRGAAKELARMVPHVRMNKRFLPPSYDHTTLCAGINARTEKVPDTFFEFFYGKANVAISLIAVSFMMSACEHAAQKECSPTAGAKKCAAVNYAPDELLVKFKYGTDPSKIKALNDLLQVQVVKTLAGGQVNLVKIPTDKSLEEVRRAYSASPEVESVGLNYKAVAQ